MVRKFLGLLVLKASCQEKWGPRKDRGAVALALHRGEGRNLVKINVGKIVFLLQKPAF